MADLGIHLCVSPRYEVKTQLQRDKVNGGNGLEAVSPVSLYSNQSLDTALCFPDKDILLYRVIVHREAQCYGFLQGTYSSYLDFLNTDIFYHSGHIFHKLRTRLTMVSWVTELEN